VARTWASGVVLALTLASLVTAAPGISVLEAGTAFAADGQSSGTRIPLILIHGLGGSADAFRAPGGVGLEQRLEQAGYVRGRDLFVLDYREHNNGDYVHVAADHLRTMVGAVLERTGSARVDLLGYSMGGLVARYYVGLAEAARVRTVVLLASPAHGSFAANIVKDAEVTQSYLDHCAGVPAPGGPSSVALAESARAASSTPLQYVFSQALKTFEPLLMRFLLDSRLGRRAPALEGFPDWLDRVEPERREGLFDLAQTPLGASRPEAAVDRDTDPDHALTRAYLNLLALNAARVRLQASVQGQTAAVGSPGKTGGGTGSGEPTDSAGGRAALYAALEKLTGWMGIQPEGLAIDRLLAERFTFRPGREYLGNYFLSTWNGQERGGRRQTAGANEVAPASSNSRPRYVVVAGTVPNLFSLAWPGVKPNDGAVEAASAWLPLGREDSFALLAGQGLATSHLGLKLNRQVVDLIVQELAPGGPAAVRRVQPLVRRWFRRDLEWGEAGSIAISRWAPTYLDVTPDRLKGHSGTLTIDLSRHGGLGQAAKGLWRTVVQTVRGNSGSAAARTPAEPPLVWAELRDSAGSGQTVPIKVTGAGRTWRVTLELPAFGEGTSTLRLGIRWDADKEALPQPDVAEIAYRVRFQPRDQPPAAAGAGTVGQGQGDTDHQGAASDAQPGTGAAATAGGPDSALAPLVWVRRGTKETTHRDAAEETHAAWSWDFGDGTTETDDDPNKLAGEREHVYGTPGRYRVTATSLSNLGRVLRQQAWDVTVGGDEARGNSGLVGAVTASVGQATRFAFETLRPPWLRLELEGPVKWVTRRPATYTVKVVTLPVPWVVRQKVTVDPARTFRVAWEKPGTYVVRAAVTVETTYRLPEGGIITLRNTYIVSKQVKVFTPALADL